MNGTKLNDCKIRKLIDLKLVREILVDSGVEKSTRPQTRNPRALVSAHQSFKTLQATPHTNVKINKDPGYKTHWLFNKLNECSMRNSGQIRCG